MSLAKKCYDDQYTNVITYLKEVIKLEFPLNYPERGLIIDSFYKLKYPFFYIFSDSKRNVIKHKCDKLNIDLIKNAKEALFNICNNAICLLDDNSVEKDIIKKSIAHYKCFKAMNYHELAYYTGNNGNDGYKNKALELYKEATEIANEYLNPAHPVKLYIAWNFSNFYI